MKWTPGHVWVADDIRITEPSYFMYKYILMWKGKHKKWESGLDRIADLALLPEVDEIEKLDKGSIVLSQDKPLQIR